MRKFLMLMIAVGALVLCPIPSSARIVPMQTYSGPPASTFGTRLANAGDMNGDGYDDIIVAEYQWENAVDVCSGQTGAVLWRIWREQQDDGFGGSVSGVGDLNQDNISDFMVSAQWFDGNVANSGRVYIFFGSDQIPPGGQILNASNADIIIDGDASTHLFGHSVSGGGDIDGDGKSDIIVSSAAGPQATGHVYVFYGSNLSAPTTLTVADADVVISGITDADRQLGDPIGLSGDINGDSRNEIVISDQPHTVGGVTSCGVVYVFFGGALQPAMTIGNADLTIVGESQHAFFGRSISSADTKGDGTFDLIVSAPYYDGAAGVDAGRVYVFTDIVGPFPRTINAGNAQIILDGQGSHDNFGQSVAGIGDIGGYGRDFIGIGAPLNGDMGKAYIYDPLPRPYPNEKGLYFYRIDGDLGNVGLGRYFGFAITGGDFDGDGLADWAVSDPFADAYGQGQLDGRVFTFSHPDCGPPGCCQIGQSVTGDVDDNYYFYYCEIDNQRSPGYHRLFIPGGRKYKVGNGYAVNRQSTTARQKEG
jgi:hypothetical protein